MGIGLEIVQLLRNGNIDPFRVEKRHINTLSDILRTDEDIQKEQEERRAQQEQKSEERRAQQEEQKKERRAQHE